MMAGRSCDDDINGLDADEGDNHAAEAVDQQVALEHGERADRLVGHAFERQRNQRDDDERVEDDGAEDRALRLTRVS
jgi:hypothetical protein